VRAHAKKKAAGVAGFQLLKRNGTPDVAAPKDITMGAIGGICMGGICMGGMCMGGMGGGGIHS